MAARPKAGEGGLGMALTLSCHRRRSQFRHHSGVWCRNPSQSVCAVSGEYLNAILKSNDRALCKTKPLSLCKRDTVLLGQSFPDVECRDHGHAAHGLFGQADSGVVDFENLALNFGVYVKWSVKTFEMQGGEGLPRLKVM